MVARLVAGGPGAGAAGRRRRAASRRGCEASARSASGWRGRAARAAPCCARRTAAHRWTKLTVPDAEKLDFRDVDAIDATTAYVLSIGPGPASRIYKTTDAGADWTLQFTNEDPKGFFDAMAFWDGRARTRHGRLDRRAVRHPPDPGRRHAPGRGCRPTAFPRRCRTKAPSPAAAPTSRCCPADMPGSVPERRPAAGSCTPPTTARPGRLPRRRSQRRRQPESSRSRSATRGTGWHRR